MGLFSSLFGSKPKTLQKRYWELGYDIDSFSKATGVSINTLAKYSDSAIEEIPARTRNKIAKVINV